MRDYTYNGISFIFFYFLKGKLADFASKIRSTCWSDLVVYSVQKMHLLYVLQWHECNTAKKVDCYHSEYCKKLKVCTKHPQCTKNRRDVWFIMKVTQNLMQQIRIAEETNVIQTCSDEDKILVSLPGFFYFYRLYSIFASLKSFYESTE